MASYKRKTEFATIDYAELVNAVKIIKIEKIGFLTASKRFGIPRSLKRYVAELDEEENINFFTITEELIDLLQRKIFYKSLSIVKMVFTLEQETDLVQYIQKCAYIMG